MGFRINRASLINLVSMVSGVLPPANGGVANITTADTGCFLTLANVSPGAVAGTGTIVSSNNQVRAIQFVLPYRIVIGTITVEVTSTVASSLTSVGIYNAAGTTKLVDSGAIDTSSGAFKKVTITPVVLEPGIYWYAGTSNDATVQMRRIVADATNVTGIMNNNTVKKTGVATNSSSAGVLPASLGSPAIATGAAANLPIAVFER